MTEQKDATTEQNEASETHKVVDPNAAATADPAQKPPAQKSPNAVGVGIIGAGVIAGQYLGSFRQFADVDVRFIADMDPSRARARAEEFDIRLPDGQPACGSNEELLARPDIAIVLNLTTPAQHAEVDRQILEAGKHVWSEKPIAMSAEQGRELIELAESKGLRISCAPDTMLGPGLQTALRAIESGQIGDPLTGSFVFQTGGPESWHPDPEFLFAEGAGPLFDMGPYYISAAVRLFGPVVRVAAVSSTARATRTIGSGPRAGTVFPVDVPTHHAALLVFQGGQSAQAVFSFQNALSRVGEIEVSGTEGSLRLPDPNRFDGDAHVWLFQPDADGLAEREVPVAEVPWARGAGVVDLARSLKAGVPEQASGAMAMHVLDVLIAIRDAAAEGRVVEVDPGSFVAPPALPQDWDPTSATL